MENPKTTDRAAVVLFVSGITQLFRRIVEMMYLSSDPSLKK
jgi:hypothetical protein